jgi:hypothetical protein
MNDSETNKKNEMKRFKKESKKKKGRKTEHALTSAMRSHRPVTVHFKMDPGLGRHPVKTSSY